MTSSDLPEVGRAVLQSQPFSRLIGATVSELSRGYAELRLPLRPEHQQHHGFAHGGVLSY